VHGARAGAAGEGDSNIRGTFKAAINHRNRVVHDGVGHGYAALLKALQLLGATGATLANVRAEVRRTFGMERLSDAFGSQVSGERPVQGCRWGHGCSPRPCFLPSSHHAVHVSPVSRQAAFHVAEAEYYVPPDAVPEVPGTMTPTELVAALEGRVDGTSGTLPTPGPLASAAEEFFAGASQQVLVVLGEPGAGKSMFTWRQARRVADAGWLPVVLDLKEHKVSALAGVLPRHLLRCGVPDHAVSCLAKGTPPRGHTAPVKLAVFCDGFDELQIDDPAARSALRDFAGTLCGSPGAAWPVTVLRVVVTTRGSALASTHDEAVVFNGADGAKHARRVVLPFSDAKVRCCILPPGSSRAC
jgi:hypothetical protein